MKKNPVEIINRIFPGAADPCERIVACLHYSSFFSFEYEDISLNEKVQLLEKGVLYKGMIDLSELSLLDKCFFVTQKFTEFGERYMISAQKYSKNSPCPLFDTPLLLIDWKFWMLRSN